MMYNRGNFLLKNGVSILLTALGFALLLMVYLRVSYFTSNQESENAKHLLNVIEAKLNALSEGQSTQVVLQGFDGGDKWYIVGWNYNDSGRPEKCFLESCVCICKSSATAGACQGSNGFCRFFGDRSISVSSSFLHRTLEAIGDEIQGPGGRGVETQEVIIPVSYNCIKLQPNLFEFSAVNNGSALLLARNAESIPDPWGDHSCIRTSG